MRYMKFVVVILIIKNNSGELVQWSRTLFHYGGSRNLTG